ncbi:hypothetical protein A3709_19595 [Halioglobus sp. HI00S01]|uniref:hypothetical protein n=1 Tax=Halioglobus sp. HI00S01 TaxID=1822214 RepID=UPI0007C3968F|nr:hypothetical protein [Halioglobus sp. HI00S01]KZX57830.1 hypothetical protein A3709_19595 [Halioglobus sp. HI00S01]
MKKILIPVFFVCSAAHAGFSVDYEGLDEERAARLEAEKRISGVAPEGFRVLTDNEVGVVYEIGDRPEGLIVSPSRGSQIPFANAMNMIMPEAWVCYVSDDAPEIMLVSWEVSSGTWVDALTSLGHLSAIRFVVDWDKKVIQARSNNNFAAQRGADPVRLSSPDSGDVFILTEDPEGEISTGGVLLKDGGAITIEIQE